jgi:hypothetical protein
MGRHDRPPDEGVSTGGDDPRVQVVGEGVRTRDVSGDIGVEEAKQRFGGLDVPATLAGMLAALGTAVLLGGLLAAAGNFGYQQGVGGDTVTIAGLVAGILTLVVAFLVGGWVAGRIARYDGGRNGVMTAVWFVILAALLAIAGAWAGTEYDVFANVELPQWFTEEARGTEAVISGLVALVAMFAAGFFGGKAGERYHRRADALIVHTRGEGILATRQGAVDHGTVDHGTVDHPGREPAEVDDAGEEVSGSGDAHVDTSAKDRTSHRTGER